MVRCKMYDEDLLEALRLVVRIWRSKKVAQDKAKTFRRGGVCCVYVWYCGCGCLPGSIGGAELCALTSPTGKVRVR